jgi:hypothetical protein
MTAIEAYERHASRFQGFAARWPPKVDNRQLQTGTGKLYTTAISTAITAVIFSLVDRSMASSERDANFSAALYTASRAYAVTVIRHPTGCFWGLSPRPLVDHVSNARNEASFLFVV